MVSSPSLTGGAIDFLQQSWGDRSGGKRFEADSFEQRKHCEKELKLPEMTQKHGVGLPSPLQKRSFEFLQPREKCATNE